MATLDVLSDGPMGFGIGASWMRTDYDAAADITHTLPFRREAGWVRDAGGDPAARFGLDPADAAASPILLIGSPDQIAQPLEERRERWGFSYFVVQGIDAGIALEPVVARLAGN